MQLINSTPRERKEKTGACYLYSTLTNPTLILQAGCISNTTSLDSQNNTLTASRIHLHLDIDKNNSIHQAVVQGALRHLSNGVQADGGVCLERLGICQEGTVCCMVQGNYPELPEPCNIQACTSTVYRRLQTSLLKGSHSCTPAPNTLPPL